jgi:hypothetical protein
MADKTRPDGPAEPLKSFSMLLPRRLWLRLQAEAMRQGKPQSDLLRERLLPWLESLPPWGDAPAGE